MKNEDNTSAFLFSGGNKNVEIIKYLYEKKAKIDEKNNYGETPLHFACQTNKKLDVIEYLINELGFDPNETNNYGDNCLHLSVMIFFFFFIFNLFLILFFFFFQYFFFNFLF